MQVILLPSIQSINFQRNRKNAVGQALAMKLGAGADTVSFGAGKALDSKNSPEYEKFGTELKNIHELPCMYCGRPVLNYDYSVYLSKVLSIAKGSDLISILGNKEKYMTESKKKVAELIKQQAEIDKNLDFLNIVEKIAPRALIRLQNKQLQVIEGINKKFSKKVSSSFKDIKILDEIKNKGERFISQNNPDDKFRRKKFLAFCEAKLAKMNNSKIAQEIYSELEKLPTSENDEDAFIVKYASYDLSRHISRMKAKNINFDESEPYETIKAKAMIFALFQDSWATYEHIRPQTLYDKETGQWLTSTKPWHGKGADAIENIGISCRRDNRDKNGDTLAEYIKRRPAVKKNVEKYLATVLRETNNSEYVNNLARTLQEEAGGSLDIDEAYLARPTSRRPINIKKRRF